MSNKVFETSRFDRFFFYLLCFFPILLVTGPLLPDLSLVLICIYFLTVLFLNKDNFFINNKFFKIFTIFYVYIVFNSIVVSGEFISIKSSITYIRFVLFLLAISYLLIKNKEQIKYLFYSVLITFLILSIDSIFQKIFGFNIIGLKMSHPIRVSSFFGDELILGSFIIKLLPILISFIFYFNLKNKNLISIGIVIISIFPIVFSAEKAALAIFCIFLFIFFIGLNIKLKNKLFLLTFSISIIFLVLFTSPNIKKRVIDQAIINSQGGEYIFSRVHDSHFKTAYKMFIDKPFFGHGPKMFRVECSNKKYLHDEFSCSTHPHNFYIQLLAETGLIGFLFLSIFYLWVLREYIIELYGFFKKKKIDSVKYFLLSSVLMTFLPISVSGNFFNNWVALNYTFSIGLLYFYLNHNTKKIFD